MLVRFRTPPIKPVELTWPRAPDAKSRNARTCLIIAGSLTVGCAHFSMFRGSIPKLKNSRGAHALCTVHTHGIEILAGRVGLEFALKRKPTTCRVMGTSLLLAPPAKRHRCRGSEKNLDQTDQQFFQ